LIEALQREIKLRKIGDIVLSACFVATNTPIFDATEMIMGQKEELRLVISF